MYNLREKLEEKKEAYKMLKKSQFTPKDFRIVESILSELNGEINVLERVLETSNQVDEIEDDSQVVIALSEKNYKLIVKTMSDILLGIQDRCASTSYEVRAWKEEIASAYEELKKEGK